MSEVVTLRPKVSAREPERRIFYCTACVCYSFKIVEFKGEDWLACANCEAWVQEFRLTRTRADI
jgi:hypothetical protein